MTSIRAGLVGVLVAGVVAAAGVYAARPADPPPADAKKPAPDDDPPFNFNAAGLTADDLVGAFNLDVYKYQVTIPQGGRFAVVLRELDAPDAAPRELKRFSFKRVAADGRTTIRVDFTRTDRAVGPVLLTDQEEAFFRVSCPGCDPTGVGSVVPVPLRKVELAERSTRRHSSRKQNQDDGESEVVVLSVVRTLQDPVLGNYPRAELVIEPE